MKTTISCFYRNPVKFRMPTAENLVPIRLDIEIEGQRYKDAFTWNPSDPDSEVVVFAKRTAKDLKLPPAFVAQIAQSIQVNTLHQWFFPFHSSHNLRSFDPMKARICILGRRLFRSRSLFLDLRVNHTLVKDQFLWDSNNFESDPKEFARLFCKDTGIEDPEVGVSVSNYHCQLLPLLSESSLMSKGGAVAVDLVKLFGPKSSVGKERSGTYRNLLSTYYPTRKLMPLKQRKREISGEFTLWSATPHQKGI
ncbi:Chromatin structure-remodeling complex protein BSH [Glycine soja]